MSSSSLLETIKIEDGIIGNLPYHQKRLNNSRKSVFDLEDPIDLKTHIKAPKKGLYRCRVTYAKTLKSIEYIPYVPKVIYALKVIPTTIDYSFKYAQRDYFTQLLKKHDDVDEVILEKEGYITDTTISNIAFYDGKVWVTPKYPLLKGTMREKLVDEGFLELRNIKKESLSCYTHLALINAMIGFKIIKPYKIKG